MLLVKSPNPNERGRASIAQLNYRLSNMLVKCKEDTDYASRPAPWYRRPSDCRKMVEAVETNVAKVPAEILRWKDIRVHTGKTLPRGHLIKSQRV